MRRTTDIPPRLAEKHPGEVRLDSFDCILPPEARIELIQRHKVAPPPIAPTMKKTAERPTGLRGILNFAAIIMTPVAMVAILVGIIAAFVGLKSGPSPEMQRIALTALDKVRSGQPSVPPSSAVAAYCTTERALAITQPMSAVEVRRAAPAVMRGELASLPVRRAALLKLPN